MRTYHLTELSKFRQNQKFTYNNKIYTVYAHERGMTEVYDGIRFWAWNSTANVIPITFE